MDGDLTRLPTGALQWRSLVDYAVGLGDLAEIDYLELKGRLPFSERADRKRSAVVLSRAILGMANRMPTEAGRHLGGHGVVLVGIDQADGLVGSENVDGAVLHDAVVPYVGEDGPVWDYQFIDHDDRRVLAIVVSPPAWGDRIHACRKEYADHESNLSVRDGDVLVRVPGKTRPASSQDLLALEQRRARAPQTDAQISIGYSATFDRVSRVSVVDLVTSYVEATAARLINGHSRSGARTRSFAIAQISSDFRTSEDFQREIVDWKRECEQSTEIVAEELLRHELSRGQFEIRNESDRYLENVDIELLFPPHVAVLMASDTRYCDHGYPNRQFQIKQLLPAPPVEFGKMSPLAVGAGAVRGQIAPNVQLQGASVTTSGGAVAVSWPVGDLPPRAVRVLNEPVAVVMDVDALGHGHGHGHECSEQECTSPLPSQITVDWRMTARAIDHVFRGDLFVNCEEDAGRFKVYRNVDSDDMRDSEGFER